MAHCRQQAWQALRQHGLAGARRARHQYGMASRGGHLQRALGLRLALYLGQIRIDGRGGRGQAFDRPQQLPAHQVRAHMQQRVGRQHRARAGQRRLRRRFARQDEGAPGFAGAQHHGQRAANGPQGARQGQLPRKLVITKFVARHLPGSRQHAQGNGQVEAAGLLGQVRRRQVDRDAPGREIEVGVLDGGAHPVARLLHLGFGQADDGEGGEPTGQVDFDADFRGVHPVEGARTKNG